MPDETVYTLGASALAGLMTDATRRRLATWPKDADSLAASVRAESLVHFNRIDPVTLVAIHFVPDASVVPDDTHYGTLIVRKRNAAGGAATVIAQLSTTVLGGPWTARSPKSLGALAETDLGELSILTLELAKAGSGVVIPAGLLVIEYLVDR